MTPESAIGVPSPAPGVTSDSVLRKARDLGFVAAGIAAANPSTSMDRFDRWIEAGFSAGMDYMSKHRSLRADPRLLAPGARSILAVAARYPRNPDPEHGFSSYAWGRDYHEVLRERLRHLAAWIAHSTPLHTARVCIDSAPILEREWAVRAGIGWRGRQGQIVTREAGCCIVLGFLLVDIDLEPTPAAANRCGTCRRCLNACPTGALQPDGSLDARRCISYWTVEHRGSFPEEVKPTLKGSLFGCDRCTAVCPWNRFGESLTLPELRAMGPLPDAATCATITDADFTARFHGSAVSRTGPAGLRRNAAIACSADGTPRLPGDESSHGCGQPQPA